MQQAILITAYKNYHHLEDIIQAFDGEFGIYIHIDKRSHVPPEVLSRLNSYAQVKLISQKYKVNWAGLNHLRSILFLAEEALKNKQAHYFHLISGHDYPTKTAAEFLEFFNSKNESQYICHFKIPRAVWPDNGGLDRIEYYNFYDLLDAKNSFQNRIIRRLTKIQQQLGIKRSISSKMPTLYGGSTWWSLTRSCVDYVVSFTKENKNIFNRFKHTLCSEEFYFSTIVMHSPFANKAENENFRFIDWIARNGNCPAILDDTDFDKLVDTKAFFARKFEYPKSVELLNKLKKHLDSSEQSQ